MRVWRICRHEHTVDALGGRGGLHASGRWHTKGRRVVYTSGSIALAALEVLVHVDPEAFPDDLVLVEIEVPDDVPVEKVAVEALPEDWRSYPAPPALRALGDAWLEGCRTAVFVVPSAPIARERNFLLNPAHADHGRIRVVGTEPFAFDPRAR